VRIWFDPDCSPRAFSLLFRASSRRPCPCLSTRAPLLGFPAVRRIRSEGVHIPPKLPPSGLRAAFRVLSPSSRSTPPSALQVYFTPQTPFGFTLQGFSLSSSRKRLIVVSGPPCRYLATDLRRSRRPTSWRWSARESVPPGRCYPGPTVDPLLGFSLSRVFHRGDVAAHHCNSSHVLSRAPPRSVARSTMRSPALRSLTRLGGTCTSFEMPEPS